MIIGIILGIFAAIGIITVAALILIKCFVDVDAEYEESNWEVGGQTMEQESDKQKRNTEIEWGMIYLILSFITTLCLISSLHRGLVGWAIIFIATTVLLIAWGLGGVLK